MSLFPYRNKPKDFPRLIARIAKNVMTKLNDAVIGYDSNLYGAAPVIDVDYSSGDDCCCYRVITVSQGDSDSRTIQEAIDFAATFNPGEDDQWVIKICPGVYYEVLTGSPYISLIGAGETAEAVIIRSSTNTVYTAPNSFSKLNNLTLELTLDAGNAGTPVIDHNSAGDLIIENCRIISTATESYGSLIQTGSSINWNLDIRHSYLEYRNNGTTAGINSHIGIYFSHDGRTLLMKDSIMNMQVDNDSDDIIYAFYTPSEAIIGYIDDCVFNIRNVVVELQMLFFIEITIDGDGTFYINNNNITLEVINVATQINLYNIALNGTINSSHNNIVALNNSPAIGMGAAGCTINSELDNLNNQEISLSIPAGTMNYVYTGINGEYTVKNRILGDQDSYGNLKLKATSNANPGSIIHEDSVIFPVALPAVNYAVTGADFFIGGTGGAAGIIVTLPTAALITGRVYIIKKVDAGAGAVRVATAGVETIDGLTPYVLAARWQVVRVISDGTNWLVI